MSRCPCSSGLSYDECCGPLHSGHKPAPTAEALMRSRFSAFARNDVDYLLRTWFPGTRPKNLELEEGLRWVRLEVLATTEGSLFDTSGTVSFAAHFRRDGRPGVLREESTFVREDGQWRYVSGVHSGQ
jgi:SEC-C motif-containing protein